MNLENPSALVSCGRKIRRSSHRATSPQHVGRKRMILRFIHSSLPLAALFLALPASSRAQAPSFQTPKASVQTPQPATVASAATSVPSAVVTPVGSVTTNSGSSAQVLPNTFEVYTDYNWGNAMAKKLRNAPSKLFNFDRASLRDVLRFLADDAGIPFVAMQESSEVENMLVTFTLRASPFLALETIARANGVALFYDNGIWFMRPINEKEMIARTYKLRFNPQDLVKYKGGKSNSAAGGGGDVGSLDMTLQQPTDVFEVKPPATVEEIRKLLGIPTSGLHGVNAGETSVETPGQLNVPPSLNLAGPGATGDGHGGTGDAGAGGAQAIYNADANTVYVVATRQQHQWVEGFLSAVDRPQALIGIEIKFLETQKDPSKELGINWTETLEGGYGITAAAEASVEAGMNSGLFTDTANTFLRQTLNDSVAGSSTSSVRTRSSNNASNKDSGFSAGYAAVLSPEEVTIRLEAFMRDRDTSVVQYPRMLTVNNREVAIRSVVNQPLLGSISSVDAVGATGTTVAEIVYLPIGTIINVLPKSMPDGSVILNVAITISRIVGFEDIVIQPGQIQPYPVPASRVYNAALQVDSGYTLAVSGLDESTDSRNNTGVPFLKDIPGVGQLFKSKNRDQVKKNLIIFITPTLIHDRKQTEGISTSPETVIPKRPDQPSPPAFSSGGRLVGGFAALDEALAWLDYQARFFRQLKEESMTDKKTQSQLEGVIASAQMLIAEIQLQEEQSPGNLGALVKKEEKALLLLGDLNKIFVETNKKDKEF